MTEELLPYYNRELSFIRNMGAEFAAANPKIAGRLRWSGDMSEDPHVSRMIEAFALLNARTRHKLDDEFPEVTEALLNILYPHFLAPVPSAAIVQCQIDRAQGELTAGYHVKRGSTVETEPIDGFPCRFQTSYDAQLWPMEVGEASYRGQPFTTPAVRVAAQAAGVIRIRLQTFSQKVKFHQLEFDRLRFFLSGQSQHAYLLYEAILNNSMGVAVASSDADPDAVFLEKNAICPVGFEPDQGLMDYSARSFLGYRLLSEFFAFPEKFMFFEITGLSPTQTSRVREQNHLDIYIYIDRHLEDLEQRVDSQTFRLGCTPIINLYQQRAEPIRWTHTQAEYRVVPDARRPTSHEIFSIDQVVGTSPENDEVEFVPFYSIKHGEDARQARAFWHAARRRAGYAGGEIDYGMEVFLTLVDLDFQPAAFGDWTIDVSTTCVNRDLPSRLPFGGGEPRLQLTAGGPLARLQCLTPPTPTYRPSLRHQTMWQLVSHLSLNHISLVDTDSGAEALREILKLYDPTNSVDARTLISGLVSVSSRRIVGRAGGSVSAGFCRGLEIILHLDEEKFTGSGAYLFASVMERFLALYSQINSFTKTKLTTTKRQGTVAEWPPRAGNQVLV